MVNVAPALSIVAGCALRQSSASTYVNLPMEAWRMAQLRNGNVSANGIDFHYIEAGDGPLVLCLHGFPDNAYTYRYLLPALADAGFRGVAPFMRGYSPTGKPPDDRFESILLGQDAVALIAALGA